MAKSGQVFSRAFLYSTTSNITCFMVFYITVNMIMSSRIRSLDDGSLLHTFFIIGVWKSSSLKTTTRISTYIRLKLCMWSRGPTMIVRGFWLFPYSSNGLANLKDQHFKIFQKAILAFLKWNFMFWYIIVKINVPSTTVTLDVGKIVHTLKK